MSFRQSPTVAYLSHIVVGSTTFRCQENGSRVSLNERGSVLRLLTSRPIEKKSVLPWVPGALRVLSFQTSQDDAIPIVIEKDTPIQSDCDFSIGRR
jgi:hypothetical protein